MKNDNFHTFFWLSWLQMFNLPASLQNKNTRIGPFPWKRSVLQNPDRERTNQSTGICHLTNRFHVAVRLFSNRSQMTSKCGKNKKVAYEAQPSVSLMFLPHFDVLCDLLLNRRTATWNLFVLYNKNIKIREKNALLFQISPL